MAWLPWVVAPALPLLRTVCLCPGATHISGRGTPFPSSRNEKGQNTSKLQNEWINLADSGPQIQLQAPSQGYIWAYRPATTLSVLRISIQFCHYTLWVAAQHAVLPLQSLGCRSATVLLLLLLVPMLFYDTWCGQHTVCYFQRTWACHALITIPFF